jgi:hypothetical protein
MDERPVGEEVEANTSGADLPESEEDTFQYKQTKREKEREEKRIANRKALEKEKKKVDLKPGLARQPIKTPLGQKQRIQQFKEQLLTDRNGSAIIQKIIEVALDDEHQGQIAALKICMDRLLPVSMFEEKKLGGERAAIQINISGIGEPVSSLIDAERVEE